jgi:hypothetical protein
MDIYKHVIKCLSRRQLLSSSLLLFTDILLSITIIKRSQIFVLMCYVHHMVHGHLLLMAYQHCISLDKVFVRINASLLNQIYFFTLSI